MLVERFPEVYLVVHGSDVKADERGWEVTDVELSWLLSDWLDGTRRSAREHELIDVVLALDGHLPWGFGPAPGSAAASLEERLRRAFDRGELKALRWDPGTKRSVARGK